MASMQTEEDLIIACALEVSDEDPKDVTHLVVLPDEEDPAEFAAYGPAVQGELIDDEFTDEDEEMMFLDLRKAVDLIQDCHVLFHLLPMIEIRKIMVAPDWWEVVKLEKRLIEFLDTWEDEQKEEK